jgi:hypothetical protein
MKKREWILIASILALAVLLYLAFALVKQQGDSVIIRVDGQQVAQYSLSQDGEYALNGGTNMLRIEDGKAYLTDANCPDHLCVKQGIVDENGETITCLPNRLTVTVQSDKQAEVELVVD